MVLGDVPSKSDGTISLMESLTDKWVALKQYEIRSQLPNSVFYRLVGYFVLFELLLSAIVISSWHEYAAGLKCPQEENAPRVAVQVGLTLSVPLLVYLVRNVKD